MKLTLVLAGNQSQFRTWCHEQDIDPRSKNVKYVRSVQDLMGVRDYVLVMYGTYYEREDNHEIQERHRTNRLALGIRFCEAKSSLLERMEKEKESFWKAFEQWKDTK